MLVSAGLPVSANAINEDVGVHTKVSLNVRHRVVSPAANSLARIRPASRGNKNGVNLRSSPSWLRDSQQHLIAEAAYSGTTRDHQFLMHSRSRILLRKPIAQWWPVDV